MQVLMDMYIYVHVRKMKKEGMKKQARSNKQQSRETQHTQGSHFSKEKFCLRWDSNPRHSTL